MTAVVAAGRARGTDDRSSRYLGSDRDVVEADVKTAEVAQGE